MQFIRNLLALVGLLTIGVVTGLYLKFSDAINSFDPQAGRSSLNWGSRPWKPKAWPKPVSGESGWKKGCRWKMLNKP
jgi:hypothetical protein